MATWTLTTAMEKARGIMEARATDPRLTPVERAQASENANECQRVLNAMANGDVRQNQRSARMAALRDRAGASLNIDTRLQPLGLTAVEFYDGLDLMWAVADAIEAGVTTFWSVLGDGL